MALARVFDELPSIVEATGRDANNLLTGSKDDLIGLWVGRQMLSHLLICSKLGIRNVIGAVLVALYVEVAGPAEHPVIRDITVPGAVFTLSACGRFTHTAGAVHR
jgi:hypothetical protein